ncbi:MAG: hypothetical protein Q4G33_06460 [bacterium]|nr:hypothetical protein [bacterium]
MMTIYNNYYSGEVYNNTAELLLEEYGEDNGWKSVSDIPDTEVYDEMNFQDEFAWAEVSRNMEQFLQSRICLVRGTVGTWMGPEDAGKIINSFSELADAWRDCHYISITDERGHLYIEASRHDGTNHFELKVLTEAGAEYADRHYYDMSDRALHDRLWKSSKYSRLPRYAKSVLM